MGRISWVPAPIS